jgi:hypothetical protein
VKSLTFILSIGIDPDSAAVKLNNALEHCQTHAESVDGYAIQFFENTEDLPTILRGDADTIVAIGKGRIALMLFKAASPSGRNPIAHFMLPAAAKYYHIPSHNPNIPNTVIMLITGDHLDSH